jgi:hypothetical protein
MMTPPTAFDAFIISAEPTTEAQFFGPAECKTGESQLLLQAEAIDHQSVYDAGSDDMTDGDGMVALALIRQHMSDCTAASLRTETAINEVNSTLRWLIGGIGFALLGFGAFTYVENQAMHEQQLAATNAAVQAIEQTAEVTSSKTVAKLNRQAVAQQAVP